MCSVPGGPISHTDIHLEQFLINQGGRVLFENLSNMECTGLDQTGKQCSFVRSLENSWDLSERLEGKKSLNESDDIYSVALSVGP